MIYARKEAPELEQREAEDEEVAELLAWPRGSRASCATSACTPAAC
jgi:hypothetical protein